MKKPGKTSLILFILILAATKYSYAQITFQKTFGDSLLDLGMAGQQCKDGGYVIAGSIDREAPGYTDMFLVRTDQFGDTLWTKTYGQPVQPDNAFFVEQTSDDGFILCGHYGGFTAAGYSIYLVKTDSIGDTLWTKAIGGATTIEWATMIRQTTDGGYIITGVSPASFSPGTNNIILVKTDGSGNLVWSKIYGGLAPDRGYAVEQTSDNGYIITGRTESFGAGDYDAFLLKTDSNGDTLWTKTYGGTDLDEGSSVHQTADGGFIVSGTTRSFGVGLGDVYLFKTDNAGNLSWSKTYGNSLDDYGYSVVQTADDGYAITGGAYSGISANRDVYLIRTNQFGDVLWTKTYGGTSYGHGRTVEQTEDGGYFIAGYTWSFGAGNIDAFIVKTDSIGNTGCNESNGVFFSGNAATQEMNASMTVETPATFVYATPTLVGSGCILTTPCSSVDIIEMNTVDLLSIFPNPSSGNLNVTFPKTIKSGNVKMFNILGEEIFYKSISNESGKHFDVSRFATGIYFVALFDGERSISRTFVIN